MNMAVVEVRKEIKFTKETGFIVLFELGIPLSELKKTMLPDMYAEYEKWLSQLVIIQTCPLQPSQTKPPWSSSTR